MLDWPSIAARIAQAAKEGEFWGEYLNDEEWAAVVDLLPEGAR